MSRRQAVKLFAALGAAGAVGPALTACGRSGSAAAGGLDTPIRIGLVVPQSGPNRAAGDDLTNGFTLFLEQNQNRLGGHPVEVILADEGDPAGSGTAAANRLLDGKVLAISGGFGSPVLAGISDAAQAARIPVIGVNASPVGSRDAAFVWRTSYADDALGRVLGRYLAEQHGTTPVYVVGPDGPAAREVVEAFGATFTATSGRAPAAVELTPAGAVDFRAALGRVRAAGARALFCAYGGAAGVAFVRQYRELLGADGPALYGPGSLTEGAMLADLGSAARNVYTVADYSPDLDNAANRRFSAEYVKVFGRAPSAYAVASYDAATVLDRAIRRTGAQLTALTLNAALATIGPVDSPRGAWRFTDDRSPTQRWYLRQVRSAGDGLANAVASELRAPG